MLKNPGLFAGIDVGASRTKVVLINEEKKIAGYAIEKSGVDFSETAERCLKISLNMANAESGNIVNAVSSGYGRKNVSYSNNTKTEIACHAKGCFYYFPKAITIVDIGGQDNKIIKLDGSGQRVSFKMNRKCAAGTGAFLEEMSARLDIPLEDLNGLAAISTGMVKLGSYCTVFSGTEVLENIRMGKKIEDIVKGLFYSVIKRVSEMDSFTDNIVFTGGVVAHNPFMIEMAAEIIGKEVLVPEYPQLTGAFGAAMYALESVKAQGS